MDVQEVITAVSTLGFPIFCSIMMMWYVKYSTDEHRNEVSKLNEQHKAEMAEVTEAITNNTLVIQKLCDFLTKGDM